MSMLKAARSLKQALTTASVNYLTASILNSSVYRLLVTFSPPG